MYAAWIFMSDTQQVFPNPSAKEHAVQLTKLNDLMSDVEQILFNASSVFPFSVFPTQIVIEKTKINVKHQLFFGSSQVKSILISEIADVEVSTNIFLATIKITTLLPQEPPIFITNFRKQDALKLQRIIQGLMVGMHEQIDISQIPVHELSHRIEQLGNIKMSA
jgi:hypothetical protein